VNLDANAILGLGYACFVVAFVLYLLRMTKADEYFGAVGFGVLAVGLALWAAGLIWWSVERAMSMGHGRLSTSVAVLPGPLLFSPLSCGAIIAVIERVHGTRGFSPFVLLMMLGIGGYRLFTPTAPGLSSVWGDGWFVARYLGALLGYGALLVTGAIGVFELLRPALGRRIQEYELLSATTVEGIAIQTVRWALVALTAGLAIGAVRSWLTSGNYWPWTLAETWMLAVWAVCGAYLHAGRFRGWAIAAVLGMILTARAIGAMVL